MWTSSFDSASDGFAWVGPMRCASLFELESDFPNDVPSELEKRGGRTAAVASKHDCCGCQSQAVSALEVFGAIDRGGSMRRLN